MQPTKKPSLICLIACAALLAQLCGCATQIRSPDVGRVVVAPQAQLSPPPVIVQQTLPKPAGYFQCSFLTYSLGSCEKPTTSTTLTPAAGLTPTQ